MEPGVTEEKKWERIGIRYQVRFFYIPVKTNRA